jgi:hypothetical protein
MQAILTSVCLPTEYETLGVRKQNYCVTGGLRPRGGGLQPPFDTPIIAECGGWKPPPLDLVGVSTFERSSVDAEVLVLGHLWTALYFGRPVRDVGNRTERSFQLDYRPGD